MYKFRLPYAIITNNSTQFIDKSFKESCERLSIKQIFSSVEHPQSIGQAEAANKIVLQELKKRLDQAKGRWTKELHSELWAYHTTTQSTISEMPYKLTFGAEAMIPMEVGELSWRRINFCEGQNDQGRWIDLDLLLEDREMAHIRSEAIK